MSAELFDTKTGLIPIPQALTRTSQITIVDKVISDSRSKTAQEQQSREFRKALRRQGHWFCQGGCGKTIAANKTHCAACADKSDEVLSA